MRQMRICVHECHICTWDPHSTSLFGGDLKACLLALVLGTLSSKIIAMSGAASNACNLANSTKWPSDAIAAGS